MALTIIRTQAELNARHTQARRRCTIEADEYRRQIHDPRFETEDYRDIDQTAKNYLSYLLRNIGKQRWIHVRRAIGQYVAWKWMLGHSDADTFYGALNEPPGYDPRRSYVYLRDQIASGEWDRLTKQALQEMRGSE